MKIFKTPLIPRDGEERILEYIIREDLMIKVIETRLSSLEEGEGSESGELSESIKYYNLSNIKEEATYARNEPIVFAKMESGEIKLEAQNFLLPDATHEELFPEWQDIEFEEFEIPEDAEIIQLEELINPESEPVVDQVAELLKANTKIDELETYVNQTKEENETLVLSAIEMIMEMMQS